MEENIEELAVPVCQGLIKPLTIAGVSREAMILNVGVGTAFVIAVRAWYMLPFFFLTHYLLYIACKKEFTFIYFIFFISKKIEYCIFYCSQIKKVYYETNNIMNY